MLNFETILDAHKRLKNNVVKTPLLKSYILDEILGADVWLKCENLQRTGSFKFRGAFNAISQLSKDALTQGIIACSSGNHAQGVAEAARLFGAKATIIMPHDAPEIKKMRTKRSGADIVEYDRNTQDRDEFTQDYLKTHHGVFIHPFDNFDVMAGQGSIGIEIMEQLKTHDHTPDLVSINIGGGGLAAGISTAIKSLSPATALYGAEPEDFDDVKRSLERGKITANIKKAGSICDAIITPVPGQNTFPILQQHLSGVLTCKDENALKAVKFLYEELKLVVEPGGCASLATLLFEEHSLDLKGKTIVIILSGGNIDPKILNRAMYI